MSTCNLCSEGNPCPDCIQDISRLIRLKEETKDVERYRQNTSVTITEILQDTIVDFLNENLSGSGIDAGFKSGKISKNNIYIESSFHCMDEHGYYDGWQEFAIVLPLHLHWNEWKLIFRYEHYLADKYQLRYDLENTIQYCLEENL